MPVRPTLAVVFINYNHGALLRRSLGALFGQSRAADEWILIDDGSQDGSREIMAELAQGRANVTLINHATNLGVVAALNEGLRRAGSDYVYFAAADDIALPDLFARLWEIVARHPGVGLCMADFFEFSDADEMLHRHQVCGHNSAEYLNGGDFGRLLRSGARFQYPPSAVIVRRDTLVELGAYDARAQWLTDWWANLRVGLLHGACFVPTALAGFHLNPHGFSGAGTRQGREVEPLVDQLWDLADKEKSPEARETLWLAAMAAVPASTRKLMWRKIWRTPQKWPEGVGHVWKLNWWPMWRPWLWPLARLISRVLHSEKFYVAALRLFGGKIATTARIHPSTAVDRPWRLRVDAGAKVDAEVKIIAKESVHLGTQTVLGRGCVIDTSRIGPDEVGTDMIIIGPCACVGDGCHLYAGVVLADNSLLPPHSVIRASDVVEPERRALENILRQK